MTPTNSTSLNTGQVVFHTKPAAKAPAKPAAKGLLHPPGKGAKAQKVINVPEVINKEEQELSSCKLIFKTLRNLSDLFENHGDLRGFNKLEQSIESTCIPELQKLDELNKDQIGAKNKDQFHYVLIKEINEVFIRHIKSPKEFTNEQCIKALENVCHRVIEEHCFTNTPEKVVHDTDVAIENLCIKLDEARKKLSNIHDNITDIEAKIKKLEKKVINKSKNKLLINDLKQQLKTKKDEEKKLITEIKTINTNLDGLYRTKNNVILSNFENMRIRKYADLDSVKGECLHLKGSILEKQKRITALKTTEEQLKAKKSHHNQKLLDLVKFDQGKPATTKDNENWSKLTAHQKINREILFWERRIQKLPDLHLAESDARKLMQSYENHLLSLKNQKVNGYQHDEVAKFGYEIDTATNELEKAQKELRTVDSQIENANALLQQSDDVLGGQIAHMKLEEAKTKRQVLIAEVEAAKTKLDRLETQLQKIQNSVALLLDPDDIEIEALTNEHVKNLKEIDMIERSLQKEIDQFTSLYESLAIRSFGPAQWYVSQASIEFRRYEQFEQIFHNKDIQDHFNNISPKNAKQLCFAEYESGIKDIVKDTLNLNLTKEEIYKRIEAKFNLSPPNTKDVIETVANIVLKEVDDISEHYRQLARLNAEYHLDNIPGISDGPFVIPFKFQEWSGYVGNLPARLRHEQPAFRKETDFESLASSMHKYYETHHEANRAMVHQIGDVVGKRNSVSGELQNLKLKIQSNEKEIEKFRKIQSMGPPSTKGITSKEKAKLRKEIAKLNAELRTTQHKKNNADEELIKYHICNTLNKITGKDLPLSEIRLIIQADFEFLQPIQITMMEKFIISEVARIQNRHAEVDQHLEKFVDRSHILKKGFSNSPTALRIIFSELSECADFEIFHKGAKTAPPKQQEKEALTALKKPAISTTHKQELDELRMEAAEEASERYDQTIASLETSALTTVSLDVDRDHAEFSRWHNENLYSDSNLNVGQAISSQTLRGVFSLWGIYKGAVNKKRLKLEVTKSKQTRDSIDFLFNKKIDKLQKTIKKIDQGQQAHPLRSDYVRFLKSFDLAAIQKTGLNRGDLLRLQRFYQNYQSLGDSVFVEDSVNPAVDPIALQSGKELFESLTEIFSLSKDLYLLNCDIDVREAILEDNKEKFAELWKVNGSIAIGSLFQAGISDAGSAASLHLGGFDPIGASKDALRLGVPIAGVVLGAGSMALGIKDTIENVNEYRKNRKEIVDLQKEIEELNKTPRISPDFRTNEFLIKVKQATITRIKLNEGMMAKIRGAKGVLTTASGAANVTSSAIAIAGGAAFATSIGALSATGIGLAVVAGVAILTATGISLNEYLKSKKFSPVLEQLKKVHEAQEAYHKKLHEKVKTQGLDAMHAELHMHLEKELIALDNEIAVLKTEYEKFVDGEIETRISRFWLYKDEHAAPMRAMLRHVDSLNPERADDRRFLQSIIIKLAPNTTFSPEEDLRIKAKKLIESQVLGNLHQGLMSQIGVFSSHSITEEG